MVQTLSLQSHDFFLLGWSFFVNSVVSLGFVINEKLVLLRWNYAVLERTPCGVGCCMLRVFWAEHWRLEGMFVLMKVLVHFEWQVFGVLMDIRLL